MATILPTMRTTDAMTRTRPMSTMSTMTTRSKMTTSSSKRVTPRAYVGIFLKSPTLAHHHRPDHPHLHLQRHRRTLPTTQPRRRGLSTRFAAGSSSVAAAGESFPDATSTASAKRTTATKMPTSSPSDTSSVVGGVTGGGVRSVDATETHSSATAAFYDTPERAHSSSTPPSAPTSPIPPPPPPSSPRRRRKAPKFAAAAAATAAIVHLASSGCPASFAASSESLSSLIGGGDDSVLDQLRAALDTLETLPRVETIPLWLAILTVSEMVPLLPTQPLALTSGILFGSVEGALIIWVGNVAAATFSFVLAGGVGRKFAEKIIEEETGGAVDVAGGDDAGIPADDDEAAGGFAEQWRGLQRKLAESNPAKQAGIISLYRVTPHPFSASNYLFGVGVSTFF